MVNYANILSQAMTFVNGFGKIGGMIAALNDWVNQKLYKEKVSMRQLAKETGIDHTTISRVLSGKQEGKLDFYLEIARFFDAVGEVLLLAGILPEKQQDELSLSELVKIGRNLTPQERLEVLNYVDYLLMKRRRDPSASDEAQAVENHAEATT